MTCTKCGVAIPSGAKACPKCGKAVAPSDDLGGGYSYDLMPHEAAEPSSSVPAVEAPSAAFCMTWRVLDALAARGVGLAAVTHAAGLSATGDPALDGGLLPANLRSGHPCELKK